MHPDLNNSVAVPDYVGYADLTENNEREQLMDLGSFTDNIHDQRKITRALKGRKLNLLKSPHIKRQRKKRKPNVTADKSGSNSDESGNSDEEMLSETDSKLVLSGRKRKHSSPDTSDSDEDQDIEQTNEQTADDSKRNNLFDQVFAELQQLDVGEFLEYFKSLFTNLNSTTESADTSQTDKDPNIDFDAVIKFMVCSFYDFDKRLKKMDTKKNAALEQLDKLSKAVAFKDQMIKDRTRENTELENRLSVVNNQINILFEMNQVEAGESVEECTVCPDLASINERLQTELNEAKERVQQLNNTVAENLQEIASLKLENSRMERDLIANRTQIGQQDQRAESDAESVILLEQSD